MTKRQICVSIAAIMAGALVATGSPASAAPTADTTVTFELTGAGLDITASATADLGAGVPGTSITGDLGNVTVTDSRGSADASWTASVTSTNFETGGGGPTERVLASDIDYWSGPASDEAGNGTFAPGQLASGDASALSNVTGLTAFTHSGGTGVNTATWDPSLIVNVPAADEIGTYTGTVTHSVA